VYIESPSTASVPIRSDQPFFMNSGQTLRYQEVHGSADFYGYGFDYQGGWITKISFQSVGDEYIMPQLGNIEIRLSTTTTAGPSSLDPVFANNVGANEVVAFGPGPLIFDPPGPVGPNYPGGGWGPSVTLQHPFFYRPSDGSLLMEVRNSQGLGPVGYYSGLYSLASFNNASDSVSAMYSYNVNATTADTVSTKGLLALFHITPVPEPSHIALFGIGVVLIWIVARKQTITS
jgi:hypothetical protein